MVVVVVVAFVVSTSAAAGVVAGNGVEVEADGWFMRPEFFLAVLVLV